MARFRCMVAALMLACLLLPSSGSAQTKAKKAPKPVPVKAPKSVKSPPVKAAAKSVATANPNDPKPEKVRRGARIDLDYIPAEAFAALILQPRRVLTVKENAMLPREVATAAGQQYLGFDPAEVDQVIVAVGPPGQSPLPLYSVVLRFANPYDKTRLLPAVLPTTKEAAVGPLKYQQSANPMLPSVYFADDRTVVIAPSSVLEAVLPGEKLESPLLSLLSRSDAGPDAQLVFSMEAAREMAKAGMATVPALPGPLGDAQKLPDLLSAAKITCKLSLNDVQIRATLVAVDEPAGQTVEQLVNQALAVGRQMVQAQAKPVPVGQGGKGPDLVEQAVGAYSLRVSNQFFDSLKPSRDTARVTITYQGTAATMQASALSALLLPAIQAARDAGSRTPAGASNELRMLGLGMQNYVQNKGKYPWAIGAGPDGKPLLSWRVHLLPYLEQPQLYAEFHLDEPWDSEHNKALIPKMPRIYAAAGSAAAAQFKTVYLTPRGQKTMFPAERPIALKDIKDGTSNTIMIVEASDARAVVWTKPDDYDVDQQNPAAGLTGLHPGGFMVAIADGSVRMIPDTIDKQALWGMFTRAGGETIAAGPAAGPVVSE